MSVKVQNLTKVYGDQKAVDAISFEVKKGEILGFLGPNGAGKSTTMKIATGFIPPSQGKVEVSGFDVMEYPISVRERIGYLPEHNPLYLEMFVHEYLRFVGGLHKLKGAALKERVSQMVETCGLSQEQNKKIGALSKGYRQRVGLAQSLIHDPEVLILDEPTTGLDPNQIAEIRDLITEVSLEKTVIFSTHIMQEVQAICKRAVIINQGKIVADNKVSELKSSSDHDLIKLEFKNEVDIDPINNLKGIQGIELVEEGIYQLKTDRGADLRSEIFALAAKHNWPLVGLQQIEGSLEDVFKELTQKEKSE